MLSTISPPPIVFTIPVLVDSEQNLNNSAALIPDGMIVKIAGSNRFKVGEQTKTWNQLRYIDAEASQLLSGLMSAADKKKLDSIPTNEQGTVPDASTTVHGLMSAADKSKVDKISSTGNAPTATKLATARTISLTGPVTGSTTFDGSENVSITTTVPTATQSVNGLMTAADKKKLDTVPVNSDGTMASASTTKPGLMSAADKTKLDGIGGPGTITPKAHGTAAVGTSTKFAREDHVHPTNDTDTHWTTHLYVGASNGSTNAATANGSTYLMVLDNTIVRDRKLIKGTGATTVTSDASGNITINSTNTTYTLAGLGG